MNNAPKVVVQIINAFVDEEKGGNPAGVVLNADYLSNEQKQRIASNVVKSETTFISQSLIADYKLNYFMQYAD